MKRKILVTIATIGYIVFSTISPLYAATSENTFTKAVHKHYVPKTVSSTCSDKVTNWVVDGISFYITKINNASDNPSNYTYIRVKLVGSSDTIWTRGCNAVSILDAGSVNSGENAIILRLKKKTYTEIFTASVLDNNVYSYYYGNDKTKAANVYIEEGINEEVAH